MKKQKKMLFDNKTLKKTTDLAGFLHTIADKIAQKKVVIQENGNEICIELPEELTLQMKAKEVASKKGVKHSVILKFGWMDVTNSNFEIK